MRFLTAFVVFSMFGSFSWAVSDSLAKQRLEIRASDAIAVVEDAVPHAKEIFERYEVATDSSMEILSPLQIGGTDEHPRVKVTLKKCVLFICQEVELDAEVSVTRVQGNCDRNYSMVADLSRSGKTLTDYYDYFSVAACLTKTAKGGTLDLNAQAHRAGSGGAGIVRDQILDVLKMQIKPIVKALNETLKAHGAR